MSECNEIIYKSQIKCSLTILKLSFIVKTFAEYDLKPSIFKVCLIGNTQCSALWKISTSITTLISDDYGVDWCDRYLTINDNIFNYPVRLVLSRWDYGFKCK